jgi:hypothetical protein
VIRPPGVLRRLVRRTAGPLRDELAISWRAWLIVVALAAVGLLAAVPVLSLRRAGVPSGTALALDPVAPIGAVATWTAEATGPAGTRAAALADLFAVLVAVAWAALAVAIVAVLARLVAQSYERAPEIGIRRAVGARHTDILLTQLAESSLATAAVLAIGIPLGAAALTLATSTWPGPVQGTALSGGMAAAIVAAVLAAGALLPLTHRSARRLVGGDPLPVTLGLPALQIAASVALLTGSAGLLRQSNAIGAGGGATVDAGAVWDVDLPGSDAEARAAAYASLLRRLAADSRHDVASLGSRGAHSGLGTVDADVTDCGFCVRGMIVMRWLHLSATHHAITPDTFTAAGIELVEGRVLELTDDWTAQRVAVVNRHLAARYFEPGGAVGRDIYIGSAWPKTPHRVVGIVDDERPAVLGGARQPRETVYLSALQHPPAAVELVVRTPMHAAGGRDDADTATLLRAQLGASARFARTGSERDRARSDAEPLAWFGRWFGVAGVAALVVAMFATFDTVGLWVQSVAGELAMRRAVGATRRRTALFVATRAGIAVIAGSIAGVLVFTTLLRGYLARSVPHLPAHQIGAAAVCTALLLVAALAGAAVATRRFLRTEPARWLH